LPHGQSPPHFTSLSYRIAALQITTLPEVASAEKVFAAAVLDGAAIAS
jgi:hypothetical protein